MIIIFSRLYFLYNRNQLKKYLGSTEKIKQELNKINKIIDDSKTGIPNMYVLNEMFLVRRYKARKRKIHGFTQYNTYYQNLGASFSSCSLELFHLLTILQEKKGIIFPNIKKEDKICVLMFVPDACTSSAMQGGIAVSKANKNFEIINITQTSTIKKGVMMITKIREGKVERL